MNDGEIPMMAASASIVFVIEDEEPVIAQVSAVGDELAARFSESEIIIVANGCSESSALILKELASQLPDVTVEFLAERGDYASALLVGMENAIGDYLIVANDVAAVRAAYPDLLTHARAGRDIVLICHPETRAPVVRRVLERIFIGIYNQLTGGAVLFEPPVVRLYSRPAALHLLHSPRAELLLRSARIAGGFPAITLETGQGDARARRPLGRTIGRALQALLSSTALPLRLVTISGMCGSAISLLYTIYIVYVYLKFRYVAPGWTTMSLQLAFATFMICSMFALLAEYIVLIHRASSGTRRAIAREMRSQLTRRAQRINVINPDGQFHLGAPRKGES